MTRDEILRELETKRDAIQGFGVKSLGLFGSAVRGDNGAAGDLDFVVELEPKTFANYMGLKEYLENLFGCRVDLVTEEAIKPALRENILSGCVHAPGL
ncbi:MAG: nucleotidyltransferase family protein [Terriglobia bacterium]